MMKNIHLKINELFLIFLVFIFANGAIYAEEINISKWTSLLEEDKDRSKLLDLSVDQFFFIAIYGNGESLTSACFWYRHGYEKIKSDSVLLKLKSGKILNWTHNNEDIPIKIERDNIVSKYYSGYTGKVLLREIDSVSIEVVVNDNLLTYKLTYKFMIKDEDVFQVSKIISRATALREEMNPRANQ